MAHAHPEASRPKRNSLSRACPELDSGLWPVQISDHSPLTFSSPRSRNWRKPPPTLLDLAEDRFHRLHAKGVTLGPAWSATSAASGPWGTGAWVCVLGAPAKPLCRGASDPARRTVHAQGLEVVDRVCRVIASVGRNFPGHGAGVADGLRYHAHAFCLSEVWLVARAATITWWAWSTTA